MKVKKVKFDEQVIKIMAAGGANSKDVEKLQQEYNDLYNAFPKTTGEGESITLETAKAQMNIDLKGNTSQETTTGKNLFNIEGQYETGTGITFTKNNDGSYTLNGTANGNNFLRGLCYLNEQHTISYSSSTTNSNVIIRTRTGTPTAQTGIQDQLAVSTTSGNLTSSKQFDFVEISIVSGTTLNNFKIYIQLEKGSSVTSFEPYTNGASPNPDYPQDVHVVSGDNEINVVGKNLLNIDNWVKGRINNTTGNIEYASNVSSMTIGENGIAFVVSQAWNSGIASDFIPISTGSYCFKFLHNREISVYIDTYDKQKTRVSRVVSYTDSASPTTRTFTIDNSDIKYIRIHFEVNTANIEYIVSEMQLEKGSTATTYEPYQSQSYNVNLGSLELCKIGDYQDYIYKQNDKWYKYGAIGKVVLNGSENYNYESGGQRFSTVVNGSMTQNARNEIYSNYFRYASSGGENGIAFNYSSVIYLYNYDYTNVNDFKNWLSTHNTIVYYKFNAPTNTEITDATLISHLEALKEAYSYAGQTNISQVNNDKPFIITAKALKDLSNL